MWVTRLPKCSHSVSKPEYRPPKPDRVAKAETESVERLYGCLGGWGTVTSQFCVSVTRQVKFIAVPHYSMLPGSTLFTWDKEKPRRASKLYAFSLTDVSLQGGSWPT